MLCSYLRGCPPDVLEGRCVKGDVDGVEVGDHDVVHAVRVDFYQGGGCQHPLRLVRVDGMAVWRQIRRFGLPPPGPVDGASGVWRAIVSTPENL